jgi:hypothetical protein
METGHTTETAQAVPSDSGDGKAGRAQSRQNNKASRGQAVIAREVDPMQAVTDQLAVDRAVVAEVVMNDLPITDENSILAEESVDIDHISIEHEELAETISCVTFDASPDELTDSRPIAASRPVVASPPKVEEARTVATTTAVGAMIEPGDHVSKKDLVALLEDFVRVIKTDEGQPPSAPAVATGTGIELSRAGTVVATTEASIDDRTEEIDQLRGLVIEAQDTIIKLLTDRVDDSSRIASLEAQLALIPDLQAQADRAMSVAVRTEDYRTELNKMKFELDRFRLFRVRIEAENRKATVFNRIQKWLFSRPNAKDDTLQSNN